MKVLLPTPGTPDRPMRSDLPLWRQQRVQQFVGAGAVVGPLALQQRDGPGQRAALARPPLLEQLVQQGLVGGEHVGWR